MKNPAASLKFGFSLKSYWPKGLAKFVISWERQLKPNYGQEQLYMLKVQKRLLHLSEGGEVLPSALWNARFLPYAKMSKYLLKLFLSWRLCLSLPVGGLAAYPLRNALLHCTTHTVAR
jgi:hypothetical protein